MQGVRGVFEFQNFTHINVYKPRFAVLFNNVQLLIVEIKDLNVTVGFGIFVFYLSLSFFLQVRQLDNKKPPCSLREGFTRN